MNKAIAALVVAALNPPQMLPTRKKRKRKRKDYIACGEKVKRAGERRYIALRDTLLENYKETPRMTTGDVQRIGECTRPTAQVVLQRMVGEGLVRVLSPAKTKTYGYPIHARMYERIEE
jgi:hypothetical protein